jgi:hypothetical protein
MDAGRCLKAREEGVFDGRKSEFGSSRKIF